MIECLGCGMGVNWDGKTPFAYTCPCGGTTFHNPAIESFHPPSSLVLTLVKQQDLAHIDYYLGTSAHTSERKTMFIQELREKGAIWFWECEECREDHLTRILERIKLWGRTRAYPFEYHPALQALLINKQFNLGQEGPPEGWDDHNHPCDILCPDSWEACQDNPFNCGKTQGNIRMNDDPNAKEEPREN